MNRMVSAIVLVLLATLAGPCESRSVAQNEGVIKIDYEGSFRVPEGTELVSLVHEDPYRWEAELRFTDAPASQVAGDLLAQLKSLVFHLIPVVGRDDCAEGAVRRDGTVSCVIAATNPGGGGEVSIEMTRAAASAPGSIRITRQFLHRVRQDPIGSPHPPEKGR